MTILGIIGALVLSVVSAFLLWVFSMGRPDTIEQVYTGIFRSWSLLASICAFTSFIWMRLFASPKKSILTALGIWVVVGSLYTAREIAVMKCRKKTAERNNALREKIFEPDNRKVQETPAEN